MPSKPKKPCKYPGCPELVSDGAYCGTHKSEGRGYDLRRGSAASRGYGSNWRRLRGLVLSRVPLCSDIWGVHAEIGEVVVATEVDHITPLSEGGTNRMDNLQPLCKSCHSKKTAAIDSGFGRSSMAGGGRGIQSLAPMETRPRGESNAKKFPNVENPDNAS
jgi:5-methylcytosine-specific restriction protein A